MSLLYHTPLFRSFVCRLNPINSSFVQTLSDVFRIFHANCDFRLNGNFIKELVPQSNRSAIEFHGSVLSYLKKHLKDEKRELRDLFYFIIDRETRGWHFNQQGKLLSVETQDFEKLPLVLTIHRQQQLDEPPPPLQLTLRQRDREFKYDFSGMIAHNGTHFVFCNGRQTNGVLFCYSRNGIPDPAILPQALPPFSLRVLSQEDFALPRKRDFASSTFPWLATEADVYGKIGPVFEGCTFFRIPSFVVHPLETGTIQFQPLFHSGQPSAHQRIVQSTSIIENHVVTYFAMPRGHSRLLLWFDGEALAPVKTLDMRRHPTRQDVPAGAQTGDDVLFSEFAYTLFQGPKEGSNSSVVIGYRRDDYGGLRALLVSNSMKRDFAFTEIGTGNTFNLQMTVCATYADFNEFIQGAQGSRDEHLFGFGHGAPPYELLTWNLKPLTEQQWQLQKFFFFQKVADNRIYEFFSILHPSGREVVQYIIAMASGDKSGMSEFGLGGMATLRLESTDDKIDEIIVLTIQKLCCDVVPQNPKCVRLTEQKGSKEIVWLKFLVEAGPDDAPQTVNERILDRICRFTDVAPGDLKVDVDLTKVITKRVKLSTLQQEEMQNCGYFQVKLDRKLCRHSVRWVSQIGG